MTYEDVRNRRCVCLLGVSELYSDELYERHHVCGESLRDERDRLWWSFRSRETPRKMSL